MKTKTLLAITTIGTLLTFSARADFFDNFDSYANQAAFNSVWTAQSGGTVLSLETATVSSAPNAISQSTTVAAQVTHLMNAAPLTGLDWTFNYYLSGNSTRDFAQLYLSGRHSLDLWTEWRPELRRLQHHCRRQVFRALHACNTC